MTHTKSTKEYPHKLILYMYNIALCLNVCTCIYLHVCVGKGVGGVHVHVHYDQKVGSTTKLGSGVLLVVFELEM